MKRHKLSNKREYHALIFMVSLIVIPPVAAVGALYAQSALVEQPLVHEHTDDPLWVPINGPKEATESVVDINLSWKEGSHLLSPELSGTVTEVSDSMALNSGDRFFSVDGVWVIAAKINYPFYREISKGMSGKDVASLNELLINLGFSGSSGDRWTWRTAQGVNSLARLVGLKQKTDPTFEPSWVISIPADHITLHGLKISVGQVAPSKGSEVATLTPTLENAEFEGNLPRKFDTDRGAFALKIEDSIYQYRDDDESLNTQWLSKNTKNISEKVSGILIDESTDGSFSVPASALVTSPNSDYCLVSKDPNGKISPVPAEVVGGDPVATFIQSELKNNYEVVAGLAASSLRNLCESD